MTIEYGRALKHWLVDNGMKQQDFAARVGVTPDMLSKIIKGRREPTEEQAEKIEREKNEHAS